MMTPKSFSIYFRQVLAQAGRRPHKPYAGLLRRSVEAGKASFVFQPKFPAWSRASPPLYIKLPGQYQSASIRQREVSITWLNTTF